ncbi:MAG: DUF3626 domain-containing protein, partial [Terriglobus roseus]|nr:DUF3626 domain-containing protein [Terriglobus roseus]
LNVHFQPDLPYTTTTTNSDGTQTTTTTTVISSLAHSQQYHSQFRTGISNGGLLATSGRAKRKDSSPQKWSRRSPRPKPACRTAPRHGRG